MNNLREILTDEELEVLHQDYLNYLKENPTIASLSEEYTEAMNAFFVGVCRELHIDWLANRLVKWFAK